MEGGREGGREGKKERKKERWVAGARPKTCGARKNELVQPRTILTFCCSVVICYHTPLRNDHAPCTIQCREVTAKYKDICISIREEASAIYSW